LTPPPRPRATLAASFAVVALGVALALVGGGVFRSRLSPADLSALFWTGIVTTGIGVASLVWVVRRAAAPTTGLGPGDGHLTRALVAWNERDDALSPRQRAVALILVSVLGLYFELVMIRLLGSEIKVFAFLKNVVLIAAFLGLGLGFFLARRRIALLPLFLPAAAFLVALASLGARSGLFIHTYLPGGDDIVLVGLVNLPSLETPVRPGILAWIPYYGITLVGFLFVVLVFVPLGQYTGKCMRAFAPIAAYSLNLAGALAGVVLFAVVSFAWLPPWAWFALAALAALMLARGSSKAWWAANLVAAVALVALPGLAERAAVWSPYNKLVVRPLYLEDRAGRSDHVGYQLRVGAYYYQDLLDLSDDFFANHPDHPPAWRYTEYEVPYALIRPRRVLILGAGTGNDAAAALRHGAERVDAVDIDPGILALGKSLHPERPYDSERVTLHADDARAFLKRSAASYDLVLFGLLDSQQVLSAFGSVRLDNFVYTVEGMRDAFARVKPGGLLAVTFELFRPWIGERIAGLLQRATGQVPVVLSASHGTVFLVRNGTPLSDGDVQAALSRLGGFVTLMPLDAGTVSLTTDDWPYLYLRERALPFAYWTMLPLLALMALWVSRRVLGTGWSIQWRFFWLGAAFMLMEVRIIAEVALLFGSTWLVNAAAIASVLVMAILANLLVARRRVLNVRPWAVLLLVSLAASSVAASSGFLTLGQTGGGVLAALLLAVPIFFAGMVFSSSLQRIRSVDTAIASNLLGAILGGLIEYVSLVLGIGSLAWLAALLYVFALLSPVAEKQPVAGLSTPLEGVAGEGA
jgi:SAM-dependent methyltransferase